MNGSSQFNPTERLESIKAGILAGIVVASVYAIATLANSLLLAQVFEALVGLQSKADVNLLVSGAIASLSGCLFGITYRYIIRSDTNSHLNDGAVLAFGLVRGLAQVDVGLKLTDAVWSFSILGIESILLFAIARFTLDLAMQLGWIKPFTSS